MPLTIGTHLGSYEITGLLGKGGMGEVYRARDTKLKRDVAIKILPDEFSRDADRASRFQREAEVLATFRRKNEVRNAGLTRNSARFRCRNAEFQIGGTEADVLGL
jgi:serine/threonine protein kinase